MVEHHRGHDEVEALGRRDLPLEVEVPDPGAGGQAAIGDLAVQHRPHPDRAVRDGDRPDVMQQGLGDQARPGAVLQEAGAGRGGNRDGDEPRDLLRPADLVGVVIPRRGVLVEVLGSHGGHPATGSSQTDSCVR